MPAPSVRSARAVEVGGVLLLYHRPVLAHRTAETIAEHIGAFAHHSRFPVYPVNVAPGMPRRLPGLRFPAILLHYTLFDVPQHRFDEPLREYLATEAAGSYKVAFFQDEYTYCRQRFEFLNRYAVDCVYTILEPRYAGSVYGAHTGVSEIVSCLTGYVSDGLLAAARRHYVSDAERTVDIGYRGRRLPLYFGRSGQEKHEIAERFAAAAAGSGLRLDIASEEHDRLYGEAWYRFLANCRAVLGTESGVAFVDFDDQILGEYNSLVEAGEQATLERLEQGALGRIEGRIPIRTVAPRHFEAAALRLCQILYAGDYAGIMEPMVHYIPLRKDFSNFDEVIERFRDPDVRRTLTDNAHRDLIASGRYSYSAFVDRVDRTLEDAGLTATRRTPSGAVSRELGRGQRARRGQVLAADRVRRLRARSFPGKVVLRALYRTAVSIRRRYLRPEM